MNNIHGRMRKHFAARTRLGTIAIDDVLPHLDGDSHVFGEFKIETNELRLQTFKEKGVKCAQCGIEGKLFAIEIMNNDKKKRLYFDLYAVNDSQQEILMTHDHIIPKSMGGAHDITNTQPMCCICNNKKGSKINFLNLEQKEKMFIDAFNAFETSEHNADDYINFLSAVKICTGNKGVPWKKVVDILHQTKPLAELSL